MRTSRFYLSVAYMLLLSVTSIIPVGQAQDQAGQLFFHKVKLLSLALPAFSFSGLTIDSISSPSSSAVAFEEASPEPVTGPEVRAELESRISVKGWVSGWAGAVAWLTRPFRNPVQISPDRPIKIHIWMSSNDPLDALAGQGSVYFAGIASYMTSNDTVRLLWSEVRPSGLRVLGKNLPDSPAEFVFEARIDDYLFGRGDMILFFVGAGSNKESWKFTVYFDSQERPSRASLPLDLQLAVPEFDNTTIAYIVAIVAAVALIRSKTKMRPKSD